MICTMIYITNMYHDIFQYYKIFNISNFPISHNITFKLTPQSSRQKQITQKQIYEHTFLNLPSIILPFSPTADKQQMEYG